MKIIHPKQLGEVVWRLFPILQWSRKYSAGDAVGDLIAGVTVALTLIPQAIAYASLAGFEPQYGLYASVSGGFVYAIMGTIPQINTGPTALLSLLTFTYTHGTNPDFAVLFCFLAGIVEIIAGVAQLGFLVEFVSLPVVSGFTSATAVTIASSQLKGLLGLRYSAETFITNWQGVFEHIGETRLYDSLLSLGCCLILVSMKALKEIRCNGKNDKKDQSSVLQRSLWFTGVARNAVVVVLATVVAYSVHENQNNPLILTGKVTPGLPKPQPPPFNTTIGDVTYSFWDMISHLGFGIAILPIIAIISNVAVAKAFARDKKLDATQEIIALGVCGIVGSFFRSFPINGSFTRSAVSDASGVRSPAAGIVTGVIVILTLVLLTPYFYFIPRATLSSVIICAVLSLVDVEIVKKLWTTNKLDLIPLFGTFLCCLGLGVEKGLVCGVGFDVLLLLCYHSRPTLETTYVDNKILPPHYIIRPVGSLHFAGTERIRSKTSSLELSNKEVDTNNLQTLSVMPETDTKQYGRSHSIVTYSTHQITTDMDHNGATIVNGVNEDKVTESRRHTDILVVQCDSLYRLDYTCLNGLKTMVTDWQRKGQVIWCDVRPNIQRKVRGALPNQLYCVSSELPQLMADLAAKEIKRTDADTSESV